MFTSKEKPALFFKKKIEVLTIRVKKTFFTEKNWPAISKLLVIHEISEE